MTTTITVEAASTAAFADVLAALDHETRAVVTATHNGTPWATVEVSPLTDTARSVFPTDRAGVRGDTRRRGQSGAIFRDDRHPLVVVIDRARRMHDAEQAYADMFRDDSPFTGTCRSCGNPTVTPPTCVGCTSAAGIGALGRWPS